MTTLTLVQTAGIAIDQAINLIISENRIDEAVEKLNEAKVCTMKMEQMINPPEPEPKPEKKRTLRKEVCNAFGIPEVNLFIKSRKREICNARQVYVYLIYTTKRQKDEKLEQYKKRTSPSAIGKHTGFDHATIYHCERVVQNYYDTESNIRKLIDRLTNELIEGKLDMPIL